MNFKNLLSGVVVVAGLATACGGEAQESVSARSDTGSIESPLVFVTALGEEIPCNIYRSYSWNFTTGSGTCALTNAFTHNYGGGSVIVGATSVVVVQTNGLIPQIDLQDDPTTTGINEGVQILFVGNGNGSVSFTTYVAFRTDSVATGRVQQGVLSGDQCLTKPDGSKLVCKGGTMPLFDVNGYLYGPSCSVVSTC
ncbi:hypothetical protein [Archangium sp.]|uniref:hypothetical protein n=1 Tax=Archangium sp. TaxID=1872627 RepID=UPI00389A2A00